MKLHILILLILVFSFQGCSSEPQNPPIDEIRQQVLKNSLNTAYPVETRIEVKGISFQFKKRDIFLVFADLDMNGKIANKTYIAQKYSNDSKQYWQVIPATEENLRMLGIYNSDGK